MATLFDTTTINGMTLANRFVRSATWEGMANDDLTVTTLQKVNIVNDAMDRWSCSFFVDFMRYIMI
jgi:2,4-dienoyl-CoA reductase-like NADH-dependent reductase (Old Yellow Enzyme family)